MNNDINKFTSDHPKLSILFSLSLLVTAICILFYGNSFLLQILGWQSFETTKEMAIAESAVQMITTASVIILMINSVVIFADVSKIRHAKK